MKTMNDYILQQRAGTDENKFYVYLHIRETDGSVFYVGKGCGSRAWSIHSRNKYWNSTYKKHGMRVEILFDDLSEQDALQSEIDAISELTYFNEKLCNLTTGGDNCVHTPESRKKMSEARKGKTKTAAHCLALSLSKKGKLRPKFCGNLNPNADTSIYTFANLETHEIFVGTRGHFAEKHSISVQSLCGLFTTAKPHWSCLGWCLVPSGADINECISNAKFRNTPEGKLQTRFGNTVYIFKNLKTEITFTGTRLDFVKKYGVDNNRISALFCKNPRYTIFDWILVDASGCAINPPKGREPLPAYFFKNINGLEYTATKVNMAEYLGLSEARINDMFRTTPKSVQGWTVMKETNDNRTKEN